ncbi:Paf1 complex component [Coemansia sp. RSA 552]|nr:Paf1 complex component [Coemansia sp. RSA 552]
MSDLFESDLSDIDEFGDRSATSRKAKSARRDSYDRDNNGTPPPRDDLFGSDTEDPAPVGVEGSGEEDGMGGLFGSGDEISAHSDDDRPHAHSGDDDGGESDRMEVRVMSARVPVLPVPRSAEKRHIIARTPNILQLAPTPFKADVYEDILAEEHRVAKEHGYRSAVTPELISAAEGIISNTIRWRHVPNADKRPARESNARLVRWSDGSTTVVVGGRTPESYGVSVEQLVGGAKEQHFYAAAHHPRELLMQNHARLTEQWLVRPSRQSAQARSAVSLLLDRVRAKGAGEKPPTGAGGSRRVAGARTRFVVGEDSEAAAKREIEEAEQREKQRRREERQQERREAREYNASRTFANEYSDSEDREDDRAIVRSRAPRRVPGRAGAGAKLPKPQGYVDEDDDGFIVDDDAELEVGPRDDFDDEEEEEEEEEELAARRLREARRTTAYDGDHRRTRGGRSRRLADDDDDESEIDDF